MTDDTSSSSPRSASQVAQEYAQTYLSEAAQQRLANPNRDTYEWFFEIEGSDLSDTDWGQLLIEEILDHSAKGLWLDWKNNVLALMLNEDPGFDNMLSQVFEMNGLPAVTEAERETILQEATAAYGDRPEVVMLPRLQDLAISRGARILVIDNESDGLALTVLPNTADDTWHLLQLGSVLLLDASHPDATDPRQRPSTGIILRSEAPLFN